MEMREIPANLVRLAGLLALRKSQQSPAYTLLLTAELSLTIEVRRRLCRSEQWGAVRSYLRQLGPRDRLSTLAYAFAAEEAENTTADGYRALARLVRAGYFSCILTSGIDSRLEKALETEGLGSEEVCRLVVERESDAYIREALASRSHKVLFIKLQGSLQDGVLPASFPDLLEFPPVLRESLERELNQDLIVVGPADHEDAILRLLRADVTSSLYYVVPQVPSEDDRLLKMIEARHHQVAAFLIHGPYGQMSTFFGALEALLPGPGRTAIAVEICPDDSRTLPTLPQASAARPALAPPGERSPGSSGSPATLTTPTAPARTDVLLVTVTETEAQAVLSLLPDFRRYFGGHRTYYALGQIQGAQICMVQSEMGQGGVSGSLLTVSESIQDLAPTAVIMVGIAFGLKPQEQRIGDILVARQILAYELQAVVAEQGGPRRVRMRGDRVTASPRLLDRFKSGCKDWHGQRVEFGLMLSGEKLINDLEFREQLRTQEPEAIGGEMEGAGLCAAAQHHKVDWILVKAIADWADGYKQVNKERRQRKAAGNAARFTLHVLAQGGFRS
jgi:nucleoside phosphorylase